MVRPGTDLRRLRGCLAALVASLAAAPAPAPAPARWSRLVDTLFRTLNRQEGLPQQVATSVAEDGDGFLWVGTQGGLARWDGYRFRLYQPDPKVPGSLPDNYVRTLHRDRAGRLWVGTSGGGLARYDPVLDRFAVYGAGPGGLSHVFVRAIEDDGAGGLWIGTDGGLDHLDPATGAVLHRRRDGADPASLPHDRVSALLRDRSGRLWVGTKAGLVRLDPGAAGFTAVPLPTPRGEAASIGALFEDGAGRIWVGTSGHGVFVLGEGGARWVDEPGATGGTIRTERIFALAEGRPGEVWVGTLNQGILAVDAATLAARRLRHDASLPTSLPDDTVWALHRDRSGLVWVGTGNGLARCDAGQTAVLTVFGGPGRPAVSDPNVWGVQCAGDGRVWLGLGGNGADVLDPERGRVAALRPDPARPDAALPKDQVLAIAAPAGGEVYLGTQRGLYRADRAGRGVRRVAFPGHDPGASADSLFLDGDTLWVDSWSDGLWGLAVGGGPPQVRLHLPADRLTDRRVNAIARGADGALWLGTAHGLNRFDPRSGAVERILPDPADPGALAVGTVTTLAVDAEGRLWVGALGTGIQVLEGRDAQGRPRFRRLGTGQGLPSPNVDKLLPGPDGNLWASTDDGLAVVDPRSFAVRALRRADGVAISAYWGGSGAATAQGELLFGGGGGLTVVRPGLLRSWDYRPPVVVTEARVGGRPLPAGRFNGAAAAEPLTVPASANSFAVEFSALDYSAPEENRYAYRLDGYDRDWNESDPTRRLASYTNLPPGRYVLRLRGSNRGGAWTERELQVPVRVLPAWHQTLGFRVLEALAAAAAVYGLVRLRVRRLEARGRELEALVSARTRELAEANAELVKANALIKESARLQAQVERIARHDLKTPLNSIISIPRLLLEAGDVPARQAELLRIVEEAGRRVLRMVNLSLGLFRMERGTYAFHPAAVDLEALVRRVIFDLQDQARTRDVAFDVARPPDGEPLRARVEELLSYSMFANLLKNAVEAAPAGTPVRVAFERSGSEILVRIHNGTAVSEDLRAHFFEKYRSVGKSGGTGLGNYSARLMAETQLGRIGVESAEGQGTTVWVALQAASAADAAEAEPEGSVDPAPRPHRPWRLLVVDDDPANRTLLAQYLQGVPGRLTLAVNGLEALAKLGAEPFDAVLMDLEMPVMDGLEAVRRLRALELPARPLAVCLSSHEDPDAEREARAAGFDHYLRKPVSREALLRLLAEAEAPDPAPGPDVVWVDRELEDLMPEFLAGRRALWGELEAARAAGDLAEARHLAHLLRGGFNMYGLARAGGLAQELEEAARRGDAAALEAPAAALGAHLARLEIRYLDDGV